MHTYLSPQDGRVASEKAKWREATASTKESHLNEVRALHKHISALASHLNAAEAEVQRLRSTQRIPPDVPLLMGILRAVHSHPDLPREPILHALTGALPRGKYQLPSVASPLFLRSIPLIVAIVSLSEPGKFDSKPLVCSLWPAKTVSFEVAPSTPQKSSSYASLPLRLPSQSVAGDLGCWCSHIPPSPPPPPPHSPPTIGAARAQFLQWLSSVSPSQESEEARRFHPFLNLFCPQDAPPPDFPRDSLYAQWEFLSKHVDTHEMWSQTVLSLLAGKEMQSSTQHTAANNKVSEALQQNNQKGIAGSTKSTGNSRGGPDPSIYSFALYAKWAVKAKTIYPMSPAKLAALLQDVFGQNEVCFIADNLLRGQENGGGGGY